MINKLSTYFAPSILIVCIAISCATPQKVVEMQGNYNRDPVYGISILSAARGEERLSRLNHISHAFYSLRDSFVVTLIDMDVSGSFINSKDIVVISSLYDSVAPIIPAANSNAAYFRRDLTFDFFGTGYKISEASTDGKQISIEKIPIGQNYKSQLFLTDQIPENLMITDIYADSVYNVLQLVESGHSKYVLINFWTPYCQACVDNIPALNKLEHNGVGIINFFQMNDEDIMLVEHNIIEYKIPGKNFRNSAEAAKLFSQNGYPFSVLFDVEKKKIISKEHALERHEKLIDF